MSEPWDREVDAAQYPGPGATLAPAVVFGYRAARHAATRAHP
ncbi:hypothetical protein WEI85_38655 [Actinomycetes bacterium KLBMP 9797]